MAIQTFLTSGPAAGTTPTLSNTGATSMTLTGGSAAWVNDTATGRTKFQLANTTAGSAINALYVLGSTATQIQHTVKLTAPASAPSAEMLLYQIRYGGTSGGGKTAQIMWETSGELRFLDSANKVGTIAAAGKVSLGAEIVVALTLTQNTGALGTGTDTGTANVYAVGSSTPISGTGITLTAQNFTANPFQTINLSGGTVVGTIAFMDMQVNLGSGSEIPDYVPSTPLTQPTVTKGTTTDATTVGGTNGSQVVTWGAVSNATAYDAYKILNPSATPSDADFGSPVATGVTSPYTFTGLAKGSYAYGIKAR